MEDDLEQSRDDIDAEEVEVDNQLDIMNQLNHVDTGKEENKADVHEEIELDFEDVKCIAG